MAGDKGGGVTDGVIFLTHAEVVIDPGVPVPDWGLNAEGQARHDAFAQDAAVGRVTSVWSSAEQKARDGAALVAATGIPHTVRADLGENDRSATGFLPPDAFWPVVAQFFAAPDMSVRGWERARDAQRRIAHAVRAICAAAPKGDVLVVSHGGVATLLRCALMGTAITQDAGGPHPGGGNWFGFDRSMTGPVTEWSVI